MAIIGASANLVPADKKLYALRDVTATVDNYSLIAASIMSKKIAGGADAIVIDAKVGDGAFMKSIEDARALAEAMLDLGARAGREVVCLLTDMDQPLGRAVGNALEIREAIATVTRRGAGRLPRARARGVLRGCSRSPTSASTSTRAASAPMQAIADGSALRGLRALDPRPGRRSRRGRARRPRRSCARWPRRATGYVSELGAVEVGQAALHLGAGRRTKDDTIDHAVGIVLPPQARRPGRRGRGARGDPRRHGRRRRGGRRASSSPRTRSPTSRPPSARSSSTS